MKRAGGYLIYKCRRCGGQKKNLHAPDGRSILYNLLWGYDLPSEWYKGIVAQDKEIHNCEDGHLGVADLIGFEFDDE